MTNKEQREYMELYAQAVRSYGFYIGTDPNRVDHMRIRSKIFCNNFEGYKKIPEDMRKSLSQNSDLENLAKELK